MWERRPLQRPFAIMMTMMMMVIIAIIIIITTTFAIVRSILWLPNGRLAGRSANKWALVGCIYDPRKLTAATVIWMSAIVCSEPVTGGCVARLLAKLTNGSTVSWVGDHHQCSLAPTSGISVHHYAIIRSTSQWTQQVVPIWQAGQIPPASR